MKLARFFVFLIAGLLLPYGLVEGSWAQASHAGEVRIAGRVVDQTGEPVDGASVVLEESNRRGEVVRTSSAADGSFSLTSPGTGLYRLRAAKAGFRDAAIQELGEQKVVKLVLVRLAAGSVPVAEAMEFEDKPDFTVAGVTDWTAVGGHGADTNLRTSEALARETVALESNATQSSQTVIHGESETGLKAALGKDSRSFEANHRLGEFYLATKKYRDAIQLLEAAHRIGPENYSNEYDLALAYKGEGKFAEAREQAQRMLSKGEKAELHRLLGDLDEEVRDSLAAVREYEKAATLDPSEENYFSWGAELLLHRAVPPALEVFTKGAKLHPDSERMLSGLGASLYASGVYDQAASRMCAASDLNPSDAGPYIFLGQMETAAPAPLACADHKLARFAHDQPENPLANYYYAIALAKRQQEPISPAAAKQIEALLQKAISIDSTFAEAYLQLGILYVAESKSEQATEALQKAIASNPNLGEAHYRLGVIYQRMGDKSKSQQEFKLHDECEKDQATTVERQRREIRQFLFVLKEKPQESAGRIGH